MNVLTQLHSNHVTIVAILLLLHPQPRLQKLVRALSLVSHAMTTKDFPCHHPKHVMML